MRESSRIFIFLNKLALLWAAQVSDWRFGQLIENVYCMIRKDEKDPFYLEEDEMLSYFEKYLERNSGHENQT